MADMLTILGFFSMYPCERQRNQTPMELSSTDWLQRRPRRPGLGWGWYEGPGTPSSFLTWMTGPQLHEPTPLPPPVWYQWGAKTWNQNRAAKPERRKHSAKGLRRGSSRSGPATHLERSKLRADKVHAHTLHRAKEPEPRERQGCGQGQSRHPAQ